METQTQPISSKNSGRIENANSKGIKTNLLLGYIFKKKNHNKKSYDLLKDIYDTRFYHYGDHFKFHFENHNKQPFVTKIKKIFYEGIVAVFVFLFGMRKPKKYPTILSTAYYGADFFFKNRYGTNISRPPWAYNTWRCNIFNWKLYKKSNYFRKQFQQANFNVLISDNFVEDIQKYKEDLKNFITENNIIALFLAHDTGFFEKITIEAFKELNLPTFSFAHGLQFWLNEEYFFRTDFFVTWGDLSKDDFIKNGMPKEKIIVSGHPIYRIKHQRSLKFSLENVLVLSNSLNGITPSDDYMLTDRSDCVYYLYLIQDCLSKFGVKSVRLRPHPSENPEWYKKNIDTDFFHIDSGSIECSLNNSSLVIGPTSTVFLEALYHGVNYVVFNPLNYSGKALNGLATPPIFNGDNPKVPVAKNQSELDHIISNKISVDVSILHELIATEFSLEEVYKKMKDFN